jgi:hypothetical protein
LLARLKIAGAISMMACPAIQRFVQKQAVFLSLTVQGSKKR